MLKSETMAEARAKRKAIIDKALREWAADKQLQQMTSSKAYMNQALVDAGFAPVDQSDLAQMNPDVDPARETTINSAAREFDANPLIQGITNKASHVAEALRTTGKAGLTDEEKRLIRGV